MAGERYESFRRPMNGGMGRSRREMYEAIRSSLWAERSTNEAHWRDLNDFISPRKARWFTGDRNRGDRRNQKIIDSTATFALRTCQSGMHAGMTNPARPWVRLGVPDPDLNEYGPVKEWLHTVTTRMLTVFGQTNLYNALPVHYGGMAQFGTAATSMLDDDDSLFRCDSYPIGSYAIATDHRGRINQWVHESKKTVLEIVEQHLVDKRTNMIDWSKASTALRNEWDKSNYNTKIDVCWLVLPNPNYDPRMILNPARSKPFASIHMEKGQERDDTFLKESGYNEFPILCSRWDVTGGDWYGTDCPGMVALGDIKQLQTGERRAAQALEKMLNPPLQGPSHLRNQKASLLPGDITYTDVREGQKGLHPIHEVNYAIDQVEAKQQNIRYRISRAFYEDLFLMLAQSDGMRGAQPPTATEVAERKEEKLIALGPVLERSKDELHDPMIDRAFAMMNRAGLFPPPPDELREMKLKIEYISIMAQAQKLVGVVGHERFLSGVSQMAAVMPRVLHKINWNTAVDDYADALGVNPKLTRTDEEADASAEQEAQAAAQAQQAQNAQMMGRTMKDMSQAPVDEGSVLGNLAEQVAA